MWFDESIVLTEQMESYLLGRGAKQETIDSLKLGEWCPTEEALQKLPQTRALEGWLVCPLRLPTGKIAGCDFRNIHQKDVRKVYFSPAAEYSSLWIMHPDGFEHLWDGQEVYLVEGMFDLFAMEWILPKNTVGMACGRAGLSQTQLEALRRIKPSRTHLVFDMDQAGRKGSSVMQYKLRTLGLDVVEHSYLGKDPGEVWKQSGLEGLQRILGY